MQKKRDGVPPAFDPRVPLSESKAHRFTRTMYTGVNRTGCKGFGYRTEEGEDQSFDILMWL